jgi:hypothetical protein
MTRGKINFVRVLMLILLLFGFYTLGTNYSKLNLIGFIIALIFCTVYWIGGEIDWKYSDENPKSKGSSNITKSSGSTFGQTINLIAAFCGIIGFIMMLMKGCS